MPYAVVLPNDPFSFCLPPISVRHSSSKTDSRVPAVKSTRTRTTLLLSVRYHRPLFFWQMLTWSSSETAVYANGAHCGQTITITDTNTGTVATGVVADECPSCSNQGSIDLSAGLFQVFAPQSQGTFPGMFVSRRVELQLFLIFIVIVSWHF